MYQDYYVYVTPNQAGQVTATVSWQSPMYSLNLYLYDPTGKQVASAAKTYTTSQSLQYSAPSGGYYLLKVSAPMSFGSTSFTGTATPAVSKAYVKAGSVTGSQPVTYAISANGKSNITARVAWGTGWYNLAVSLLSPSGVLVAQPQQVSDGVMGGAAEQVNFAATTPGTYTLKVESGNGRDTVSYSLITPYQL